MQSMKVLRTPTAWGVTALVILTAVAVAAGMLYISPPGQKTLIFYTDDAASIRPGDDVRVAGITVGAVKDLSLESDRVRVKAGIDSAVFVGNKSQIQVRMLTVVGGYYVNLVPLGDTPLDTNTIPVERVIMPYNLIRTLTDATKLTTNIDAKPINESLNEIQAGLKGNNLESLTAVINAGNALMSTIDKQRGQVTAMLNLTDEYIQSLSNYREKLKQMIRKVAIVEQTLVLYSKGFSSALDGVADMLLALKPIGDFYGNHRDDFLDRIREWQHRARLWIEHNGLIVRVLTRVRDHIERVLDTQNALPELLATDLCIPVPGSAC
jgi:phospholipid/cholesterol/gamma-HCH transport system substrate-binding protein